MRWCNSNISNGLYAIFDVCTVVCGVICVGGYACV